MSRWIVSDSTAQSSWTLHLAERIHHANQSFIQRYGTLKPQKHAPAGPSGIDSQEDVVCYDEPIEWTCLADAPRLVLPLRVALVEE